MDLNSLYASLGDSLDDVKDSSSGAPVHLWNPQHCGDLPIKIAFNGTWLYQNTPISRIKMVSLFSSILKRVENEYFLVTPVEKVRIQVEDVPFIIIDWQKKPEGIWVKTQSQNTFLLDEQHPVACRAPLGNDSAPVPYTQVRNNLYARFHQNVFYQMMEEAELMEDGNNVSAYVSHGKTRICLGTFNANELS